MDEGLDAKLNNVDIKNRVPDRPQTLEIAEMANNHLAKVLDRMEYYQPSREKLAPQLRASMASLEWNVQRHGASLITPAEFLFGQNLFTGTEESTNETVRMNINDSRQVIGRPTQKDLNDLRFDSLHARKLHAERRTERSYASKGDDIIKEGDMFYYLLTGTEFLRAKRDVSKTKKLWRGP